MPGLAIIIPCYNEEDRLDKAAIGTLLESIDVVLFFVNDGSSDHTLDLLNELAGKYPDKISVLSFSVNEGKAKAIAKGFQHVIAMSSFRYIGYMDADFSTPVPEFIKLYTTLLERNASFIFASRIKKLNSGINRKPTRHIIGRVISTIIDLRFKLGVYDTQCGAKIFSSNTLTAAFDKPFFCNWLFDVEIFIRLKEKNLLKEGIEFPITGWKDVHGSKLSLINFPKIVREFITLTRKY
ncbi:MAG TPA: glycosyltransferase [Puia sp.]|nr:glycosyltransferase [Puia sp.]